LASEYILEEISQILNLKTEYADTKYFFDDVKTLIISTLWESQYNFDIDLRDKNLTRGNFYNIITKAKNFFYDCQRICLDHYL